ncbi:hypothetical protein LTR56_019002 [Elasticomyces elasticus]|nr:hypothetical protein LTR56_019002 [Elasticomyces elasticus]KAK3635413.1 hypothetical protein LTR22_019221 [Elasticomyces elasticus]KAK4911804.1 hypothetical protein LTR49_019701 [Elasticomyces elasticus]KAK5751255.1 hypothetical protein LTS12_018648 [Elasticomyces elasticus]
MTLRLHPKPALLIVDMQNGFLAPQGTFAKLGLPVEGMRAVIPAINRLRKTFHFHNLPVIFTRLGFAEDYSDSGLILDAHPQIKELNGFVRGTWDADVVDELAPTDDEVVVDKTRNTCFYGTDFAQNIRDTKIGHLVVVGVGTNVCVEPTVRDAFTQGFRVVTASDATAALTEAERNASIGSLMWFGGVAAEEEVKAALKELKQTG